jgi:hypothetical protein
MGMQVLWLYLSTLPAGYFLVERFYPPRLPWAHVPGFAAAVLLWPLVALMMLRERF